MDFARLQQMISGMRGGRGDAPAADTPMADTSEKIQISSLSLLKMLKHGRAGVPMEVMGLMLGQFVDDYTITCVDVFAMPQVLFYVAYFFSCVV
jgi:26S proteasome regulatory subunit N11